MRPYHWRDNMIVGANCIRPLLITSAAHHYQEIRQALATDLLSILRNLSPDAFEKLVVELLVKMGYGDSIRDAGKALGKSGDQGIDGIIKEDRLGLDIIYIAEISILHLGARSSINSLTTVRPYHWRDNMIVGANCIRPLLITSAAHH